MWDPLAGIAVGTRFRHSDPGEPSFSPDGRRLGTVVGTVGQISTVALRAREGETALKLADVAELTGGLRVSEQGVLEPVPARAWALARKHLTGESVVLPVSRDLLLRPFAPD